MPQTKYIQWECKCGKNFKTEEAFQKHMNEDGLGESHEIKNTHILKAKKENLVMKVLSRKPKKRVK
jgi:hypothetical protein